MRFSTAWDAGHPFPPHELVLTRADKERYETLANELVAESIQASEDFAARRHSVDLQLWKLVKEKGTMAAYCTRSRGQHRGRRDRLQTEGAVGSSYVQRPKFYSTDSPLSDLVHRGHTYDCSQDELSSLGGASYFDDSQSASELSLLNKTRPPKTPLVIGGGLIAGSVDEAGLGFLADTEERSIMRAISYKDAHVKDLRILAKLRGPTPQDPFQFLGIKWSSFASSQVGGVVAKSRDLVVIEATGLTMGSNGERVFYFLSHSVDIEEVPEYRKQGLVRLRESSCRIVRAYGNQNEAECYFCGYSNGGGNFGVGVSTHLLCERLLDSAEVVEGSYMKKLAWFVHAYARQHKSFGTLDDIYDGCACCHKLPTKGLKKLLESSTTCFLCRRKVCKKCTIKKNLPIDSTNRKSLEVCSTCYLKAKKLPALQVALATVSRS